MGAATYPLIPQSVAIATAATTVDRGPVVPPETVPLLFEPFRRLTQRAQAPGEGTALGLSIVDSIAHAHGATVEALPNTEGGGLNVRVRFGP